MSIAFKKIDTFYLFNNESSKRLLNIMKTHSEYIIFLLLPTVLHAQEVSCEQFNMNEGAVLFKNIFDNNNIKPKKWTNDFENLFSQTEQLQLDGIISEFEKEAAYDIYIVTIDKIENLKNKVSGDYYVNVQASNVVNEKNGVLIILCKE